MMILMTSFLAFSRLFVQKKTSQFVYNKKVVKKKNLKTSAASE